MHILYIHQYFNTPEEGGGTRSYEFARKLVRRGHKVTMITSSQQNTNLEKIIEGINILYLKVSYSKLFIISLLLYK